MKKLLLYLFALYAFTLLSAQQYRDPFRWPYSKESIWNTPIGSDAVYMPANFGDAANVGHDIQHILYSYPVYENYPVYNSPTWGSGRCTGETYLGFDLRVPDNWIVPDAGDYTEWGLTPNSNYAIIFVEDSSVFEGCKISRCEPGGPVYLPDWMQFENNRKTVHISSDGYDGKGQGASKMSALGGTIRRGELTGDDTIRHVLKINPWAKKYCHYSDEIPGYKWPAKSADSYAAAEYNPDGDTNIVMGSLFAIPPDVTMESLGLETEAGKKLFYTLQHYGMYFTEDAAWDTWDIIVERGVEEEFKEAYGYSMTSETWKTELNKLMKALHVVVNNGPESIGGGGDPLAPLAPDFAPAPTDPGYDQKMSWLLADERDELPAQGELLYNCFNLNNYNFTTNNGATKIILDAEESLPFEKKARLIITRAGTNAWEPQYQTPRNDIPVKEGDMLFYILYIRTVDTEWPNDFGKAAIYSQLAASPWTTIGSLSMELTTEWRKYYMAARAENDYNPGEMLTTFHLGYLQQQIEIGGMIGLNLGPGINLDELPQNAITYVGMEAEAEWRAEAEVRIEQYRKSDITVRVVESDSIPVNDASVTIRMKEHAYGFGTFISGLAIENTADGNRYREKIHEMFNVATTPFYMGGNEDNWGWYSSEVTKAQYRSMAQWLQSENIPAKGHVLIWPSWQWMPSFFEGLKNDPEALRAAIDDHLKTLVPIGKEKELYEWDVVNEPFINHDIMDILGEEVLVDWYNRVHELDPNPKLILNEYNILMGGGREDFQDNFMRLIKYLLDSGAPLGGIGMQCHFGELLTGIPALLDILDEFATFNLPIQITEFDVAVRDEEIKASYLRDFYTAVFSHPATEKIVMWGFYEKVMWKPLAALVASDWSVNPNFDAYMDLVYDKWWTKDTTLIADENGEVTIRGFNGKYDVIVSVEDSVYILSDTLIKENSIIDFMHGLPDDTGNTKVDRHSWTSASELSLNIYPNPFTETMQIAYYLPLPIPVHIGIYNGQGEMVKSINRDHAHPGDYKFELSGDDLLPGIYYCVMDAEGQYSGSSMLVIRN